MVDEQKSDAKKNGAKKSEPRRRRRALRSVLSS